MLAVVKCESNDILVIVWSIHLSENVTEMGFNKFPGINSRLRPHGKEFKTSLKFFLYLIAEYSTHLLAPYFLPVGVITGIKGNDIQEIDIVMRHKECVAVKQTVAELLRDKGSRAFLRLFDSVSI